MESIKDIENISKDDMHRFNDEVQKITDLNIAKIDSLLLEKEKDIMKV
jgi:ribosome recycling factor